MRAFSLIWHSELILTRIIKANHRIILRKFLLFTVRGGISTPCKMQQQHGYFILVAWRRRIVVPFEIGEKVLSTCCLRKLNAGFLWKSKDRSRLAVQYTTIHRMNAISAS